MSFEQIYKLSVFMNMIDNVTAPMKTVAGKVTESVGKMDSLSQGFGNMTQQGMLLAGAGTQITDAVLSPVAATYETKRAIGELASVGVEDLGMMEDAARDFSNTWAGTTKADFITAAYDIKSGISSLSDESVAQYTEIAGVTATATKSNIATMTDLFATGYGIYKDFYSDLSDLEFGEMFSAGIATSVEKFKTNGNEMSSAVKSLGQSATNAQVPLEEQLSVLGMLQATMSGSEAGTKYNAFLRSAAKGGKALGINFLDANDQLLSMPEILDKLHGTFGDTIDAAEKIKLQEAFGDSEAIKLIDLLYNKTGDLQDNILNLYDSMGSGMGAANSMAEAINKTDPSKLDVLKQSLHNTAETLGNTLAPKISEYMDKASGIISKADEWISNHQELAGIIMQVVLILGAVLTVGGSTIATFGAIGLVFTKTIGTLGKLGGFLTKLPGMFETARIYGMLAGDKIGLACGLMKKGGLAALGGIKSFVFGMAGMAKQAVVTAVTAMPGLIASVWSFTAALLANPITWIVIAIIALIAGLVLLYNKCEWFRAGVDAIWGGIKAGAAAIGSFFSNLFGGIKDSASNILSAAKATVTEKLDNIKQAYEANGGGIKGIAAGAMEAVKGYFTAGFTFMDKLTGGKLSAIAEKFGGGMQKMKDKASNILSATREAVTERLDNIKQAYETNGGGIKGIAAGAMEGIRGYYTDGFNFIDNLTGGKLSAIADKVGGGMQKMKDKASNILSGAKETVTEKLDNIKQAYEANGGGIKGIAAGAMEAVKGYYSAGFTFMDNLTGGKLCAITDKVGEGMQKVKDKISDSIAWFKESGRKVMTTFTAGIKETIMHPVEAVKGGLQKIRNMLPFSDAKTGPLDSLTLSGNRVLETVSTGIKQSENLPAEAVSKSFGKIDFTAGTRQPEKISLSSVQGEQVNEKDNQNKQERRTVIEKVILNVDAKKIDELKKLLKLMEEIEDSINSGDGGGDIVPA